jgi:hypothetical protein
VIKEEGNNERFLAELWGGISEKALIIPIRITGNGLIRVRPRLN